MIFREWFVAPRWRESDLLDRTFFDWEFHDH
jgi:hypothetical protein